jgi:hypothetical protein
VRKNNKSQSQSISPKFSNFKKNLLSNSDKNGYQINNNNNNSNNIYEN